LKSEAGFTVEKSYNRYRETSWRRIAGRVPFVEHSVIMSTSPREIRSSSPKIGLARCKLSSIDVVAPRRPAATKQCAGGRGKELAQ